MNRQGPVLFEAPLAHEARSKGCKHTRFTQILLARGEAVNLVDNPKQAADPRIAAIVIVHGMRIGAFTGKRLTQFGTDSQYDFVNARTIVNGHDRAETIARIARAYRRAMN